MTFASKISTLKSLARLDAQLLKLSIQLKEERSKMDDKAVKHASLLSQSEHLEGRISQMEGTKGELQGEQRQIALQVDKSREKMQKCRNEREANAVSRELEELHRLTREREGEIQKVQGFIEAARADLEAVVTERDAAAAEIDGTQGEAVQRVAGLQAEHDQASQTREEIVADLGGTLRRQYDSILARRGTAIARAEAGRCISCHIELPPMLFQHVMRREEAIACPSCHRILYWEPAGSSADDAELAEES